MTALLIWVIMEPFPAQADEYSDSSLNEAKEALKKASDLTCAGIISQSPANPRETLKQYVANLQICPDYQALREKIIKLVQTMKPQPATPDDVVRYMARGAAAMKEAKSEADFKDAVAEFEQATLTAPWLANAYYNLGVAQSMAGAYGEAAQSLKLYLIAAPDAADAQQAKELMFEMEFKAEKRQKKKELIDEKAAKAAEAEQVLQSLRGTWYQYACFVFHSNSNFSASCNEEETRGSNWHISDESEGFQFDFSERGTIKIGKYRVGTPSGPRFEDIIWECVTSDGSKQEAWAQGNATSFTLSCDRPKSLNYYDPNVRYSYELYTRKKL